MRVLLSLLLFFIFYETAFAALSDQYTVIPPVVVSAKNAEADSLTNSPKTVITHEELDLLGVTSLAQALQEFGGVQLQDTTSNGSQVLLSMRGFGANANSNTLLMVNGIPITNPDMAPPDLNAIPIQEIQYIELISGSESVLYGDQAVGGIINIVTKQQTNDQAYLTCTAGSYDQKTCAAAFSTHLNNFKYSIGVDNLHTDNYRDHNDYDQTMVSGRMDYPYQTGAFAFDYKIANERMLYPGALTSEDVGENRRQASNDTDFFKDWNGFYHLHQQQNLNENWQFELDAARREMHGSGVLSLPFTQERVVHFIKPDIKGTIGKVLVTGGVDFQNDNYDLNSVFSTTGDVEQKYGVFGVMAIPITSRWSMSLGAREAELISQLNTGTPLNTINRATASTLGTSYQLTPNIKIYVRRADSFRFPKADENASTPPGVNGLKTQTGVSYESGIRWNYKETSSRFSIYQLNLQHEIAFDPTQTPTDPFGINRNLDPTVRKGFSFSEKYQITQKVNLGAQYNYVNARFNSGIYAGNRIPLVSENLVHAGVDYAITDHWNLYNEAVYTGNQYADNDDANVGNKIGGYTTYNFNLRYVYNKNITASFRVNNIFNKYYYLYTVVEPGMPSEFYYPAAGRNFLLTVKCLIT